MNNSLKEIRKSRGWTLKKLSERSGVPLSTIGNFENGKVGVSLPVLKKLAFALEVSLDRLLAYHEGSREWIMRKNSDLALGDGWQTDGMRRWQKIPVVSWARAGRAVDYNDLRSQIDESLMIPDCRDENAFALIIEGDSMEPDFHDGDRVILSPNRELRSGDFAAARFADGCGVVFKRFRRSGIDGSKVILESLNPIYSPIEKVITDFLFIYPAISQYRFLRR